MSSKKNSSDGKTNSHKAVRSVPDVCTLFTGAGRSAIAVIGVAGPQAGEAVMRCFTAASARELKLNEIRYGDWHGPKPSVGDESEDASIPSESIVVIMRDSQQWEVHCHGGSAAIQRIIADLNKVGITSVENEDWPYPWWGAAAGPMTTSRLIREATAVLTQCQTVRTAAVAMDQVRGALQDWAIKWLNVADRSAILRAAEKRVDNVEDTAACLDDLHREVREILAYAPIGVRLTSPFRVVLSGRPNVGKSSLINAILGYDRSIATAVAGTTRDVLHAETVIDGLPIRLTDTAGIHDSGESIEREGISRAMREASTADLVLAIQTPDTPTIADPALQVPRIDVLNKSDLIEAELTETDLIQTVATTGEGIDELLAAIANRLAGTFPPPKSAVPLNERQVRCLEALLDASEPRQLTAVLKELISG
ncbi:tRNA modification GTPase TrmE [Rhodopirellula maiorica SM1]|uniref:tRNA modification GTPase TrmE n=1 Tax=Rhodopirellula maiorica SM1 TaxID=1265738 RepID=M5S2W1_9BACT|nr:GTPase [Rhodopirellula maiorica]EMI21977.1 tRNA modification GTPase TrmE [Rhodopirellula maiorica SM1]